MSLAKLFVLLSVTSLWFLTGCASGTYKARQEQREKAAAATGLYCEFVNGEQHPDVDVELNLQMAKRCDMNRMFSLTNYRTSSEMNGIVFCCHQQRKEMHVRSNVKSSPAVKAPPAAKEKAKDDGKDDEGLPNE
jgi:hypothetical protein